MLNENFSKFTISSFNNSVNNFVVFFEIRLQEVQLLLSLPETTYFKCQIFQGVRCLGVCNLLPEVCLKLLAGQAPVTALFNQCCFVAVIVFKHSFLKSVLLFNCKFGACEVSLNNSILLIRSQLELCGFLL